MTAFVTVGTTKFVELIEYATSKECIDALSRQGVKELVLQYGSGTCQALNLDENSNNGKKILHGMSVEYFRYEDNINKRMEKAMIIIGHAGAGTILEALKLQKPFIAVINDNLMDNHQMELAGAMAERNHLICCNPSQLAMTLSKPDIFTMKPYKAIDQKNVSNYINGKMGLLTQ